MLGETGIPGNQGEKVNVVLFHDVEFPVERS